MFHMHRGQRGFTLVELLATLLLLGIVITISSMLLIQVIGNEKKTSESISLEQETNVLISELRSEAYKDKDKFCVDDSSFDLSVEEITVLNPTAASYDVESKCFTVHDSKKPLVISLKTKNDGVNTTVETVLNRKAEATFKIPKKEETVVSYERIWFVVDKLPCDLESFNKSFDDVEEFRNQLVEQYAKKGEVYEIFNSNKDEIKKVEDLVENKENLSNITEQYLRTLNPKDVSFILDKDAIGCESNLNLSNGDTWKPSVWFPNQIAASKIDMHIGGNLYTTKQFGIKNNSHLQVDGDAEFGGQIDTLQGKTEIKIGGNMNVHNKIQIEDSAIIDVSGDMEALGQVQLSDSAALTISQNATFKNQVAFQNNNVKVTIKGDADFKGSLQINTGTTVLINGNATFDKQITLATEAKLTVEKNAIFNDSNSVTLDGNFCAGNYPDHPNCRN